MPQPLTPWALIFCLIHCIQMPENTCPTSSYLPYYYYWLLLFYYYVLLLQLPTDITTLGCATTVGWLYLLCDTLDI